MCVCVCVCEVTQMQAHTSYHRVVSMVCYSSVCAKYVIFAHYASSLSLFQVHFWATRQTHVKSSKIGNRNYFKKNVARLILELHFQTLTHCALRKLESAHNDCVPVSISPPHASGFAPPFAISIAHHLLPSSPAPAAPRFHHHLTTTQPPRVQNFATNTEAIQ